MPKIYISPSNQNSNMCKKGDTECMHCNLIADELVKYLAACGIEFVRADMFESIASRVKASNLYKPDIHYCIHTNAGGGKRSVLYGYDTGKVKWTSLANAVKKYRAQIYGSEIRFAKNTSFYEINSTTALCLYDEVLFHDNVEESKFLHENIKPIARSIAQGFCEYFQIPFREYDSIPPNTADRLNDALSRLKTIAKLADMS